jgi:iron complex outermembrane receptor protein
MGQSKHIAGSQERLRLSETAPKRRYALMASAGSASLFTALLALASPAQAQQATQTVEAVTVTGSRIVRDGFEAPTPVTVLGSAEIQSQKPANIFDLVLTLPNVAPGLTAQNSGGDVSLPDAGINSVNLRYLGSSRTLVLLNGQRTVASLSSNTVDINTMPQDLIERVETVTGGASAQYGSDAVAGVVNFILNERFRGLKVSVDGGITDHGDGANYRVAAAAGVSLLNDRLHVLFDGEYFTQDEVMASARSWNNNGYILIRNPNFAAGNGAPQFYVGSGIGSSIMTPGGLVRTGPAGLLGTYFDQPGVTQMLNFGAHNTASSPFMIGGDWQYSLSGIAGTDTLQPRQTRYGLFVRPAFDVTENLTVYGQFSWNRSDNFSHYGAPFTSVTIKPDNAYLLTQYPQFAAALGQNSFSIGTSNAGFGLTGSEVNRDVYRYLAGAKGNISLFGNRWSWDAYYQHGETKSYEQAVNVWNTQRMALAQDAVLSNGSIVCRSTLTDPTNGCVPVNRLGVAGPTAAAVSYLYGPAAPNRLERLQQDVAAVSFSGDLFKLPAGPVSAAVGGEWRKEQTHAVADLHGTGWLYGNYGGINGQYDVKEGFVEVSAPILKTLSFDGAVRYTDYSTSGAVSTWKIGALFEPTPDLKFRANYSHDIRAPSLAELFTGNAVDFIGVTFPSNSPTPGTFVIGQNRAGNVNLRPEKSNTWTAGVVFRPQFLPGFGASIDYYDIKMQDNIGALSTQQIVDLCYSIAPNLCSAITVTGGVPTQINRFPYNFASRHQTGLDFEASYSRPMLDGNVTLHGQGTYYIKNTIDDLILPIDYAGGNGLSALNGGNAGSPHLHYRISATYDRDFFSINLLAHGFGSSVYRTDWISCASSCPAATVRNATINNNHIDGAIYLDGSVTVKIPTAGHEVRLSFIVKNILNKDPVLTGYIGPSNGFEAFPQTNSDLFDVFGRVYRVSATVKF